MCSPKPSDLLAQLKAFNSVDQSNINPHLRKELQKAASALAHTLQDPATATFRLTLGQAAESTALKVALDIGLFPILAVDNNKPKSLSELSTNTSTDPVFLHRLLRFLAAFHVVTESDDEKYILAAPCQSFGNENFSKATNTVLPLVRSMLDSFPSLIQENNRKNPTDRLSGAAQKAWSAPGRELFDLVKDMGPEVVHGFSTFLSVGSQDSAKMYEVYPVHELLIGNAAGGVFWVDVGGGFGQRTVELKDKFSDLPGRCIVQDLKSVIDIAKMKGLDKAAGVDFMAHDFFEQQPVKGKHPHRPRVSLLTNHVAGARTYYLRQIFHNWQDSNCRTILECTRSAMTRGYSRLLIHDIVMPERGASQWAVMMDWLMMAGYSTLERSRAQWESLVASVEGLRIEKIWEREGQEDGSVESVIEIVRA